jgi:hypothetical protein
MSPALVGCSESTPSSSANKLVEMQERDVSLLFQPNDDDVFQL